MKYMHTHAYCTVVFCEVTNSYFNPDSNLQYEYFVSQGYNIRRKGFGKDSHSK